MCLGPNLTHPGRLAFRTLFPECWRFGNVPSSPHFERIKYGTPPLSFYPVLVLSVRFQPSPAVLPSMRSCPSYPAQLPNTHLACDRSPPPLPRDVTSLQHGCDPSHMLRGAVPKDRSDGEDAVCQDRTIPPSTFSPPTILSEYHQHFPSRLTRTSALAPGFGTYGTRDYALRTLYVADNAKYAEATMPPYARSVPPNQAHTLNQMDPVWNAQSVGLGNPAASYSTHHPVDENEGSLMYTPGTLYVSDDTKYAEATMAPDARPLPHNQARTLNQMNPVWNVQYAEHGNPVTSYSTPPGDENEGSLMIPPFKPPPHDTHSLALLMPWTAEYDHANSINLGIVGGPRGCWNTRTLFDSSVCPPSNMVPPPSLEPCGHVLAGGIPTSTCPPIASNVADGTMVNAGTIPISLDRPMLRPGGGDNRERMDGIDHNSDNAAYSVAPSWPLSDVSRSLPHKLQPTHSIGNLSIPKESPRTDRSTGPSTSLPTAPKRCGWRDNDGKICDMHITYNNLVQGVPKIYRPIVSGPFVRLR
ncbi:hypothetical protein BKA82DRAFT_4157276 [Pisolithus tinctorius]|nr:hypothetical protein BKA82DRAFT_4157276 [Pisolithus tinctorius]